MSTDKHLFALYYGSLPSSAAEITITDQQLMHRIATVLRLGVDEEIILFNRQVNAHARIHAINKKHIIMHVISREANRTLDPEVSVILPVLKKDSLHEAIYGLVEAGANRIVLAYTHKSVHHLGQHDLDKLERIAQAAAEQSKQFALPEIIPAQQLANIVSMHADQQYRKIYADPQGISLADQPFFSQDRYLLMVGPEGDLTDQEKDLLRSSGFIFTRLTPTILRAYQASFLLTGAIRSLLVNTKKS